MKKNKNNEIIITKKEYEKALLKWNLFEKTFPETFPDIDTIDRTEGAFSLLFEYKGYIDFLIEDIQNKYNFKANDIEEAKNFYIYIKNRMLKLQYFQKMFGDKK